MTTKTVTQQTRTSASKTLIAPDPRTSGPTPLSAPSPSASSPSGQSRGAQSLSGPSLSGPSLTAQSPSGQSPSGQSLSAQSLSAQSLSAQSLSAQSLSAQSLSAQSLSAQRRSARRVTLFTDRVGFEQQWTMVLSSAGLDAVAARPDRLPAMLSRGDSIVIDAGSEAYDEDELLAHVGLARALGALPVVSVPSDIDVSSIDDILDDLCAGMVSRRQEDVSRIVATIARRADATRASRFEYLTVSPRGGELLAIFSDGNAVLVDRQILDGDDGTPVEAISLEDDATRAILLLASGKEMELTTATVARKSLLKREGNGASSGNVDGVRLGRRIRELRRAAGLTQAELARRTGIHRPNIARVEAGRHTPSLETLARLAAAIGVATTAVLDD